jgi:hypothetical protein
MYQNPLLYLGNADTLVELVQKKSIPVLYLPIHTQNTLSLSLSNTHSAIINTHTH